MTVVNAFLSSPPPFPLLTLSPFPRYNDLNKSSAVPMPRAGKLIGTHLFPPFPFSAGEINSSGTLDHPVPTVPRIRRICRSPSLSLPLFRANYAPMTSSRVVAGTFAALPPSSAEPFQFHHVSRNSPIASCAPPLFPPFPPPPSFPSPWRMFASPVVYVPLPPPFPTAKTSNLPMSAQLSLFLSPPPSPPFNGHYRAVEYVSPLQRDYRLLSSPLLRRTVSILDGIFRSYYIVFPRVGKKEVWSMIAGRLFPPLCSPLFFRNKKGS